MKVQDMMSFGVRTRFGWKDRLRILAGKHLVTQAVIEVSVEPVGERGAALFNYREVSLVSRLVRVTPSTTPSRSDVR